MCRESQGIRLGDMEGGHEWLLRSRQRPLQPPDPGVGRGRGSGTAERAAMPSTFVWEEGLVHDLDGDQCPREVAAPVGL